MFGPVGSSRKDAPRKRIARGYHSAGSGESSRSRSRPSPSARESSVIEPAVLMSLKNQDLHKGFGEVQQKLAQILNALDQSDNVSAFVEPTGPVAVGINTLREIATALIEKDPHFACKNRVYEDLWLMGFTRPLKLSNRFEASAKVGFENTLREWRACFILDWHGYLTKLQDTLELFQRPESVSSLLPNFSRFLPAGYSSDDRSSASTYKLPITYLLRDIALCIARIHSHVNPQLEKFWMQRALTLNTQLKGRTYNEARQRTRQATKTATVKVPSVSILARAEIPTESLPSNDSQIELETESGEDLSEGLVASGSTPVDQEENAIQVDEHPKVVSDQTLQLHPELKEDYGCVTANGVNIQRLQSFAGRNSFIQGLVAAARMQGLSLETAGDSSDQEVS